MGINSVLITFCASSVRNSVFIAAAASSQSPRSTASEREYALPCGIFSATDCENFSIYSAPPSSKPESRREAAIVSIMAVSPGLIIARSSPLFNAAARNVLLTISLLGRPNETLLTPSTVFAPSFFTSSSAESVILGFSESTPTVIVRQSIAISARGIPASSQREIIFFAISTLPSKVSGMPFSSSASPTTTAPYFFAMGSIVFNDSSLPLTELTIERPPARRSPASIAAGSEESICNGRSLTERTAETTFFISSSSFAPGTPTFMSRISAPCSCCATA